MGAGGRPAVFWYVLEVAPFERCVFMGHAGYSDIELEDGPLEELVREFEQQQAAFAFESWEAFFAWVRERVRDWRPALEPRYRAGMVERDGKVVPRPPARAAAYAIHGAPAEKQTATHDRLQLPILLLLAADADPGPFAARPNVETHRLDSGHDVPEDAPEETVRLVSQWLARLPAT